MLYRPHPRHVGLLALALVMLMTTATAAATFLSPALQAELSHFHVTTGLLDKLTTFARDANAQGIDLATAGADPSSAKSVAELARRVDAKPRVHALLEKHGLSVRDYVAATMVLMRYKLAAKAPTFVNKTSLNTLQAAFYKQHRAKADALLAMLGGQQDGPSAGQLSASDRQQIGDLQRMDKQMFGECTRVAVVTTPLVVTYGMAAGPSHYPGGAQPPANIVGLGKQLIKLSTTVPQLALKHDLSVMGHEIRKQAGHPLEFPPKLKKAMTDYEAWMQDHCSKEALTR